MARMKIIKCPLCNGKIEIDLNSGIVYRHFEKLKGPEADSHFSKAIDKVATKDDKLQSIFAQAKEREKSKDLNELFNKAAEKALEEEEGEEEDLPSEPG